MGKVCVLGSKFSIVVALIEDIIPVLNNTTTSTNIFISFEFMFHLPFYPLR